MAGLARLPLFIVLIAVSGMAMLIPAAHATVTGYGEIARIFLFCSVLLIVLSVLLGVASMGGKGLHETHGRAVLATMLGALVILPLAMAIPLAMALPDTGIFNAWWEMVSCLTTTGATLYAADMLAPPLHLWRSLVGWLGGLFILVTAVAVLAPLKVGGFEILSSPYGRSEKFTPLPKSAGGERRTPSQMLNLAGNHVTPTGRALKIAAQVAPWYAGLTLAMWVILLLAGDPGLIALCRAMGTLSTSGISPVPVASGGQAGQLGVHSGLVGEFVVFVFLMLALSRRFWPGGGELRASESLWDDPEIRLGLGVAVLVALALFARHFFATIEITTSQNSIPAGTAISLRNAAVATWGGLFNAMSFLTTTGWNSIDWQGARSWSGLQSPGLLLAGLAMMGGGVATTAGGVKLLRVYALARQSQRELDRIVHPASVAGGGSVARRLRVEGAYLAFIFFMLFAVSIAVTVLLVSIHQIEFDTAVMLSVSALTNTGPLAGTIDLTPSFEASAGIASNPWEGWSGLALLPKTVLAGAMIVGRLETLAILALFTPDFWRR
ncbi:TrkH family potassium uptake protein [Paracoccus aurantiacus]|uniref:TrkH family potassium uptake protein n=1 Tax=Paracoccus aurantiacus TaxID=2599412 RepID=A0A5C6S619_9RHOB|nr:potassium transporter TrkG [Paracoccus aurantiacus]TXB69853.1 TrkH family potassium uptake protein [Paracoccus aurantiacus]